MQVHCPNCGRPTIAAHVSLEQQLAKCAGCDNIFGIAPVLEAERARAAAVVAGQSGQAATDTWPSQRLGRFKSVDSSTSPTTPHPHPPSQAAPPPPVQLLQDDEQGWRVAWRWWDPGVHLGLLIFTLFWDGICFTLGIGLVGALVSGEGIKSSCSNAPSPFFFVLVPGLHIALGIFLAYYLIGAALNRTTVFLDRHELFIRHRPVPWVGRRIAASRIMKLKHEQETAENNGKRRWRLLAVLDDNTEVILLSGLRDEPFATYLRNNLAQRLAIA